jgi:hypothetical protein
MMPIEGFDSNWEREESTQGEPVKSVQAFQVSGQGRARYSKTLSNQEEETGLYSQTYMSNVQTCDLISPFPLLFD